MPAPDYVWGLVLIHVLDALVDVLEAVRLLVPGLVVPDVKTTHKHPHVPHVRVHAVLRVRQHVVEPDVAAGVSPAVKILALAVVKIDAHHLVTMVVRTHVPEHVRYHAAAAAKILVRHRAQDAQIFALETVHRPVPLGARKAVRHAVMDVLEAVALIAELEAVETYAKAHAG